MTNIEPGAYDPINVLFGIVVILTFGAFFIFYEKKIKLPYTVIMFVFGILMGALGNCVDGTKYGDILYGLDRVSPHAAFHIFLPILIFEGAYAMKTNAFWSVFSIVVLLAGPGVLINSLFIGFGIKLMYARWSIYLAGLLGSMLSSTDPVAVVALLKGLGVDKRLTAVVDGEAISNDGTAIILFLILLPAAQAGEITEPWYIVARNTLQLTVVALIFGSFMGWLGKAAIHLAKGNELVQLSVSICVAYITFYIADVWLGTSGVLAICCLGIYLATYMPTLFPGKEGSGLNTVWHFLVHMANTALFALVGVVIARNTFPHLEAIHFVRILVVYALCTVARFGMVMVLQPFMRLSNSNYSIGVKEAVLLTHGGLRGGVGMMLALIVFSEHAIPEVDRMELVILVAGMVVITLAVNAPTAGLVVALMGHRAKDQNRLLQMEMGVSRLRDAARKAVLEAKVNPLYAGTNWDTVEEAVLRRLHNPYDGIDTVTETDDKVFNVLLMRTFKSRVWILRDNGSISEGAVVMLTQAASRCIDLGTLITAHDVMRLMQPPLLLRLLTYLFLSNNAAGADDSSNPTSPSALDAMGHSLNPSVIIARAHGTVDVSDELDDDGQMKKATDKHIEDKKRRKNLFREKWERSSRSWKQSNQQNFYDPNRDFIPSITVPNRHAAASATTAGGDDQNASSNNIHQSSANNNNNAAAAATPALPLDGSSPSSSLIERLIFRWRLHVEGDFYGAFIGYSAALDMVQRTYRDYARNRAQAERASFWLKEEGDIAAHKLKAYASMRPRAICAFMTGNTAGHVIGEVTRAAERLRDDFGFALPAMEALLHSCHEVQHSLDKLPKQIEPLSSQRLLARSAIAKDLTPSQFAAFEGAVRELSYDCGEIVYLHKCAAVLVSGVVTSFNTSEPHVLRGPGDCFNVAGAVCSTISPEYVVTSDNATVLAVPYETLQQAYGGGNSGIVGNHKAFRSMLLASVLEVLAPVARDSFVPLRALPMGDVRDILRRHGRIIVAPRDSFAYVAFSGAGTLTRETFDDDALMQAAAYASGALDAAAEESNLSMSVMFASQQQQQQQQKLLLAGGSQKAPPGNAAATAIVAGKNGLASFTEALREADGADASAASLNATFVAPPPAFECDDETARYILDSITNSRRENLFFITGSSQVEGGLTHSVGPCIVPVTVASRSRWRMGTCLFAARVRFMTNEKHSSSSTGGSSGGSGHGSHHSDASGASPHHSDAAHSHPSSPVCADTPLEHGGSTFAPAAPHLEDAGTPRRRGDGTVTGGGFGSGGPTRHAGKAITYSEVHKTAAKCLAQYHPDEGLTPIPYLNKLQLRFLVTLEQLMAAAWRLHLYPTDAHERATVSHAAGVALGFLQLFCLESFSAEKVMYKRLVREYAAIAADAAAAAASISEENDNNNEATAAAAAIAKAKKAAAEAEVAEQRMRSHDAEHIDFVEQVAVWREHIDHNDMCHEAIILGMATFASTHFALDRQLCLEAIRFFKGGPAALATMMDRASFEVVVSEVTNRSTLGASAAASPQRRAAVAKQQQAPVGLAKPQQQQQQKPSAKSTATGASASTSASSQRTAATAAERTAAAPAIDIVVVPRGSVMISEEMRATDE